MSKKPLTECPNCQAIWGFSEIEFQTCDACGYPLKKVDEEPKGEDWGKEFDDDYED